MNPVWNLPDTAQIAGKSYGIHGDYRDILEIFAYLEDPDLPEYMRWKIALALFYEEKIPLQDEREAMEYLAWFIRCGQPEQPGNGLKLLDWQQDAPEIISDVNKVAGTEIRKLPFLHWWTFMSWFHGIGEGQLSAVISIREKLRKGEKLEKWETAFYRENRQKVDMKPRYSRIELEEQEKLNSLLDQTAQE